MTRDTLIPEPQLAAVVTALYSDAHEQDWIHLSLTDRSRFYTAWVDDDRVGGILCRYMTPEAARAWVKDGPMKEYSRAIRGTGRYARFGSSGGTTAADIVTSALGPEWSLVPGSAGVKPFHARAVRPSGEEAYLAWDESRNFKNLVWAALRATVEDGLPAHVVVTQPQGAVVSREVTDFQRAVVNQCGLQLHHVREHLGTAVR